MFDCAIIGSGPAGISAALTLKVRNKSIIWFGNKDLSIKVSKADTIKNYPGLINVSGEEMKAVFLKQIQEANLTINDAQVTGVYDMGDSYTILCNQESYEAKTIILCTGVASLRSIKGEEENVGQGVSYCATCDGFLYKGKEIAVIIHDESFEEEVEYLADLASKVYLFPTYKNVSLKKDNIEILNKKIVELVRNNRKMIVKLQDKDIEVDGTFFLKNAVAPSILVPGIDTLNGHVIVNRACETNLKGCFAAGDITGAPYQYTKAVGEGNVAAHSVVSYLSKNK